MQRATATGCAFVVACGVASAASGAGICESTAEFNFKGAEPVLGGEYIGLVTAQGEIVGCTIDIQFTATGQFDASQISATLQTPTGAFGFSGERLGWSGQGTFRARLQTDQFNGTLVPPDGSPWGTFFLFVSGDMQVVCGPGGCVAQPVPGGAFDILTYRFEFGACPVGDLTHDGDVDGLDIGVLLANWSVPAGSPGCKGAVACPADFNHDGVVDGLDIGILLSHWGPFCPLCQ